MRHCQEWSINSLKMGRLIGKGGHRVAGVEQSMPGKGAPRKHWVPLYSQNAEFRIEQPTAESFNISKFCLTHVFCNSDREFMRRWTRSSGYRVVQHTVLLIAVFTLASSTYPGEWFLSARLRAKFRRTSPVLAGSTQVLPTSSITLQGACV